MIIEQIDTKFRKKLVSKSFLYGNGEQRRKEDTSGRVNKDKKGKNRTEEMIRFEKRKYGKDESLEKVKA